MKRFALALLLFPGLLAAQAIQPPDCGPLRFSFTGPGNSSTLTNFTDTNGNACVYWEFNYSVAGSASALSIVVQYAPTGSTPATPGVWTTYPGTAVDGAITNTNTSGAAAFLSNGASSTPFMRIHLSSLTSSSSAQVYGVLQGWNAGNASGAGGGGGGGGSGCVGTVMTPCVVVGPAATGAALSGDPVRIGLSDGANAQDALTCRSTIIISDASMGNTQIIALSGTKQIYICKMSLTAASPVNVQLTQGTGSNCGTSTANLSGEYQQIQALAEDFATDQTYLIGTAAHAVCLNLGGAVSVTGQINYAQF